MHHGPEPQITGPAGMDAQLGPAPAVAGGISARPAGLISQLPWAALLERLLNAGLTPCTAAGIPHHKAVELVELLGPLGTM